MFISKHEIETQWHRYWKHNENPSKCVYQEEFECEQQKKLSSIIYQNNSQPLVPITFRSHMLNRYSVDHTRSQIH